MRIGKNRKNRDGSEPELRPVPIYQNRPYLPTYVLTEGFIERKKLNKFISTKIIELQKQADSLDEN